MTLTTEQIIDDLRRCAGEFNEAATMAPRAPYYAARCGQMAEELRNIADSYERGELMVKEDT